MPYTMNGIGTTYYGKKNLERHRAVCEHCGQSGLLESYETRLWFVVLFIPVVPLGRKQILDYCPACTRHRAMGAAEWARVRESTIRERMQKVTQNPNDPKSAVEMHASLDFFGKQAEAAKMAAIMAEQFAADAEVLLYLGGWHERCGRGAEADGCFAKALAAAPENPAAKRAVGIGCLERGEFERGRQLLAFLEEPGPNQDPGVVLMLARACQAKREHEEALKLFAKALAGAPALGRDAGFRKAVRASEAALGRKAISLPATPRSVLVRWGLPVVAVVALAAVILVNRHRAGNQTLYVVNGLKSPATVALDGGGAEAVGGLTWRALPCAEGRHRAAVRVGGAAEEAVEFEVRNGWFERFGRGGVFVLNLGGAAAVLHETAVYTPKDQPSVPGTARLFCGESFLEFRDADYVFEEFPRQITTEQHSGQIRKTRVGAHLAEPDAVLGAYLGKAPEEELLRFAELHLDRDVADAALVRDYLQVCAIFGKLPRCRAFLEKGLQRRPVSIEWHRAYQSVCEHTGKTAGLEARYEAMLAAEPGSSALLYLRGRIARRGAEALGLYERAMAADPQNPYPRFATAYQLVARGELAAARPPAAEACRLAPANEQMEPLFYGLRLGLGEHDALKAETLAKLKKTPLDLDLELRLLEVCAAAGDLKAAADAHDAYAHRVFDKAGVILPKGVRIGSPAPYAAMARAARRSAGAVEAVAASWLALLYLQGDFAKVLADSAALAKPEQKTRYAIQAHLELGQPGEAEKLLAGDQPADGDLCLLMSMAWRRAGDAAKAALWRERAVKKFASGRTDARLSAELLGKGEALELKAAEDLSLEAQEKAIVLAALAESCPAKRPELLALARKLNFSRWFPHRMLEQLTEAK